MKLISSRGHDNDPGQDKSLFQQHQKKADRYDHVDIGHAKLHGRGQLPESYGVAEMHQGTDEKYRDDEQGEDILNHLETFGNHRIFRIDYVYAKFRAIARAVDPAQHDQPEKDVNAELFRPGKTVKENEASEYLGDVDYNDDRYQEQNEYGNRLVQGKTKPIEKSVKDGHIDPFLPMAVSRPDQNDVSNALASAKNNFYVNVFIFGRIS
jgi:hypothetical protein